MMTFHDYLIQYLDHRLLFHPPRSTDEETVLRRFAAFADGVGATRITARLFLQWRESKKAVRDVTWKAYLSHVRGFAKWLQGVDPHTEVPPVHLVRTNHKRPRPYIYMPSEIVRIVRYAEQLPSQTGLTAWTFSTLFGLIAATGMRLGEALNLNDSDVDLDDAVLRLTNTKTGGFRLLPVSASTGERLDAYRNTRQRVLGNGNDSFFLNEQGRRPVANTAQEVFVRICQAIGIREVRPDGKRGHGPRIHDLRHTMAVRTIIGWYRQGRDPNSEMIKLSTYLGHRLPSNTYWYIEAVPELMHLACERAEQIRLQEVRHER